MKQNRQQQNSQDEEGILLFNQIKDIYSQKIDELNELKRQVFASDQVDQQQRSKLRISIESLLIDLNEEIFSISEELARSFTFERTRNLYAKAQDFESRKHMILKKIKETIDQNQSVKLIRRQAKIQNMSPPQRDLNTFGLPTQESDKEQGYRNSQAKQRSVSPQVRLNSNFSARKFPEDAFENATIPNSTKNKSHKGNSLQKKKKSPIPLRRKEQPSFTMETGGRNISSSTRKPSSGSAAKQLFTYDQKETKKDQRLKKNIKKLEEFERFLSRKQTVQTSVGKENKRPESESSQFHTVQLQSEAMEAFGQDFAHLKNKLLQMAKQLQNQEDKTRLLEDQVSKLQGENIKLTTDVKIIRNEQTEILHSIYTLDKKNSQLQQENLTLKRILAGERELKGQETNLPKPYTDPNESLLNNTNTQQNNPSLERKTSPFSSFLHKNRSFSNLRDSKDSSIIMPPPRNEGFSGTQNFKKQQDFVSFQPSLNDTYKDQERDRHENQQQVRSSLKNWPSSYHNPLLSVSNDRGAPSNVNHSYFNQQQNMTSNNDSRVMSGHHSRRGDGYSRIQETPQTPDPIVVAVTDDTPKNQRREDSMGGRQKSFNLVNQRLTPTSSQQHMGMAIGNSNGENGQLSDWVLERLNKKQL